MAAFRKYEVEFFTATILEWKQLLRQNKYKDILINSLCFLTENNSVLIYGFVIMNNHIHLLWKILHPHLRKNVQRDFLKFTAQHIRFDLIENHPQVLEHFRVNAKDRIYQFWERNALSVDIWSEEVVKQKLQYIHENPVKAGLCECVDGYRYSSALFYEKGIDEFGFLVNIFE